MATQETATTDELREIKQGDTGAAFAVMAHLRTGLAGEHEFVSLVDNDLRPAGYRLVGVFSGSSSSAVAVAGFRLGQSLGWGRYLYIDDMSTLPETRRAGHGMRLLEWIAEEATRLGVDQLHLDSGVGLERAAAHRLYLNAGYFITSHHFARRAPKL